MLPAMLGAQFGAFFVAIAGELADGCEFNWAANFKQSAFCPEMALEITDRFAVVIPPYIVANPGEILSAQAGNELLHSAACDERECPFDFAAALKEIASAPN